VSDEKINAVQAPDTWADIFDDEERAVLELADAVSGDSSELPPLLIEELRFHFGEAELAELILVAGQANLNNRVGNAAKQLLGE